MAESINKELADSLLDRFSFEMAFYSVTAK